MRVDAENPVTLGDLGIFMDQAAEPVPAQNPDVSARRLWGSETRFGVPCTQAAT
jgi:hypothetical protein